MTRRPGWGEGLSYDCPGATHIAEQTWVEAPTGYRRHESGTVLGHGDDVWEWATHEVLRWGVKTRSGFRVPGQGRDVVRPGQETTVVALLGPCRLREPVRIIEVVKTENRVGFSYGTRHGHPLAGEEAFIVTRGADGTVRFVLRTLTRRAPGLGILLWPAVLLLQPVYRRRYRRALRSR
ncbi:MAG: DUF1990 domain-containing protein [Brachybacterium sp.]|nr:DUF1990 domain-containing protein [Brachybacterium sp.]